MLTVKANQRWRSATTVALGMLAFAVAWGSGVPYGEANTSMRILPSGEAIEFTYSAKDGTYSFTVPIYQSGDIRYFSAGVGVEERHVAYPPFPLKLIFVAGDHPYLSQIDVTISTESGTVLHVPETNVNGPWLFIDLPEGTYTIYAQHAGQTRVKKGIKVSAKGTKTVYFRWPREKADYE